MTKEEINKIIDSGLQVNDVIEKNIKQNKLRQAQIPITMEDFDNIIKQNYNDIQKFKENEPDLINEIQHWCDTLNVIRETYLKTNDNRHWSFFWDLIPTGYVYDKKI